MSLLHRLRWNTVGLMGVLLAIPAVRAQAQNATLTGKVLAESGQAL